MIVFTCAEAALAIFLTFIGFSPAPDAPLQGASLYRLAYVLVRPAYGQLTSNRAAMMEHRLVLAFIRSGC